MIRRILILGASGMIGRALLKTFEQSKKYEVFGVVNQSFGVLRNHSNRIFQVDLAGDQVKLIQQIEGIVQDFSIDLIVNSAGYIYKNTENTDISRLYILNSWLPRILSTISLKFNCYFIHISTDCVFSGATGRYIEEDLPDPIDDYGRSKALGEIIESNVLTIRTSTIGYEDFGRQRGLLEWFLGCGHSCWGYTDWFFSGLSTVELAQRLAYIVERPRYISGLLHIAGPKISKYELLVLMNQIFQLNVEIKPSTHIVKDRSLNGDKFFDIFDYPQTSWLQMLKQVKIDGR